jgi:hypothetical protein
LSGGLSERALFERQHYDYGRYRWSLLNPEDAVYAEAEGYRPVLRDCGVGGLRFPTQVGVMMCPRDLPLIFILYSEFIYASAIPAWIALESQG